MLIGDFGTSYCKFLDLENPSAAPDIIPTAAVPDNTRVAMATGHNGKRFSDHYVNELIALARGGQQLIREKNFVLLDCGSRDIKFISYQNNRLKDMGWNAECGASMGFTIELLERYYNLDYCRLPVPDRPFSVTCGVLGMSSIFDAVVSGVAVEEAVARFVKGIAVNAFRFAGAPEVLFLSGGLCDNPLFVQSFPCRVIPLGRFVLLSGLAEEAKGQGFFM
ncbi:MAG: ATPase [Deltaproteobacteria bacterium RIFOXYD12_FULL_50_9]|nr:MAG: ATPase [Deltaproteobacteria bacterium RIFOXYD12_FULL_50_9]